MVIDKYECDILEERSVDSILRVTFSPMGESRNAVITEILIKHPHNADLDETQKKSLALAESERLLEGVLKWIKSGNS